MNAPLLTLVTAMVGDCSLFTVIEPAISLFAACLPVLRPLVPCGTRLAKTTTRKTSHASRDARWGVARQEQAKEEAAYTTPAFALPTNVAYAECYRPSDAYDRAYHSVRSAFNSDQPNVKTTDPHTMQHQHRWLREGIVVRNEVFVNEGFHSKKAGSNVRDR